MVNDDTDNGQDGGSGALSRGSNSEDDSNSSSNSRSNSRSRSNSIQGQTRPVVQSSCSDPKNEKEEANDRPEQQQQLLSLSLSITAEGGVGNVEKSEHEIREEDCIEIEEKGGNDADADAESKKKNGKNNTTSTSSSSSSLERIIRYINKKKKKTQGNSKNSSNSATGNSATIGIGNGIGNTNGSSNRDSLATSSSTTTTREATETGCLDGRCAASSSSSSDNCTVDEMIKACELEEEAQLNIILEQLGTSTSSTSIKDINPFAATTSTKTIRSNLNEMKNSGTADVAAAAAQQQQQREGEPNPPPPSSSTSTSTSTEQSLLVDTAGRTTQAVPLGSRQQQQTNSTGSAFTTGAAASSVPNNVLPSMGSTKWRRTINNNYNDDHNDNENDDDDDETDSLAGDETIVDIVERIMEEDDDDEGSNSAASDDNDDEQKHTGTRDVESAPALFIVTEHEHEHEPSMGSTGTTNESESIVANFKRREAMRVEQPPQPGAAQEERQGALLRDNSTTILVRTSPLLFGAGGGNDHDDCNDADYARFRALFAGSGKNYTRIDSTRTSREAIVDTNDNSTTGGNDGGLNTTFVTDDTSVGSIIGEMESIVANHQREVGGDGDEEQQLGAPEEESSFPQGTMVSSLTGGDDEDDTHYARFRELFGGMPEPSGAVVNKGVAGGKNETDAEKRGNQKPRWWVETGTNEPGTPSRSFDGTPTSPQHSVGSKSKDAPGTPATVIITTRHPLGLATPPSSHVGMDDGDYEYEYLDDYYTTGKYGGDNSDRKSWKRWDPLAFLKRAASNNNRFYTWLMVGVLVLMLLLLFLVLVIVVLSELGKWNTSTAQGPPSTTTSSDEPTPSPLLTADSAESIEIFVLDITPPHEDDAGEFTKQPFTTALPNNDNDNTKSGNSLEEGEDFLELSTTVTNSAPAKGSNEEVPNNTILLEDKLRNAIATQLPKSIAKLDDPTSPQYRAFEWALKSVLKSNDPRTTLEIEFNPWRLEQKYALAVLYYATNGEEWEDNTGWLTSAHECEWFSTTNSRDESVCDSAGRLAEIDLKLNNLVGSIPSELIFLSDHITSITINGNSLSGTIPPIIGRKMTNLVRFHAQWNSLSGAIPSDLGVLSSLTSLKLAKNELVGSIPWQLSGLANLETLDLMSNELTGRIPFLLGDLTALTQLNLGRTNISGEIPVELSNLLNLITLKLDRTDLEGTMPDEVCSTQTLPILETALVDCDKVYCWCCEGC